MKLLTNLIFVALLAGCSSPATIAINKAKAEANPVAALEIITKALAECGTHSTLFKLRCSEVEELKQEEQNYFVKLARSGNEQALRQLYDLEFNSGIDLKIPSILALANELESSVLERAKTSKNPDLLAAAASIYGDENNRIKNTEQQMLYLKKAGEAGDNLSAGHLSKEYMRLNDLENAYLWSLRCIGDCNRFHNGIQLEGLEKKLGKEKVIRLQHEAAMWPKNLKD